MTAFIILRVSGTTAHGGGVARAGATGRRRSIVAFEWGVLCNMAIDLHGSLPLLGAGTLLYATTLFDLSS